METIPVELWSHVFFFLTGRQKVVMPMTNPLDVHLHVLKSKVVEELSRSTLSKCRRAISTSHFSKGEHATTREDVPPHHRDIKWFLQFLHRAQLGTRLRQSVCVRRHLRFDGCGAESIEGVFRWGDQYFFVFSGSNGELKASEIS